MGDRIKCCSFLDLSPLNSTQKCLLKIKFGTKYVNSIIKFFVTVLFSFSTYYVYVTIVWRKVFSIPFIWLMHTSKPICNFGLRSSCHTFWKLPCKSASACVKIWYLNINWILMWGYDVTNITSDDIWRNIESL